MSSSSMSGGRAYSRSHPFLTFEVAFDDADPLIWMLLGEAQSKCDHIRWTPLMPRVREELEKLYLAKGVSATTAIEGNTLSENEVRQRMEGELELPPSREYLGREVDNIHRAVGMIPENVRRHAHAEVTPEIISEYNRLVLEGLDLPERVRPGTIRSHDVVVGGYNGAPAKDCLFLAEQLCEWLASPEAWPQGLDGISEALLKAVFAHLYLAWIHPFGDGNGRTARLIEVHILAGAGVPRPVAHLLSNHYNQTRSVYYQQLDKARMDRSGPLEFLRYALQGIVDGMKEQLRWIRGQVNALTWMQFVYMTFHNSRGRVAARRREVALALTGVVGGATTREIRTISPEVARMYGDKHDRAVARDLNFLRENGLVVPTDDGKWRANLELLEQFLPATAVH
jgi:Fic family protein